MRNKKTLSPIEFQIIAPSLFLVFLLNSIVGCSANSSNSNSTTSPSPSPSPSPSSSPSSTPAGTPTISSISNQTWIASANAASSTVSFTLGGDATLSCSSNVSATSSNTSWMPTSSITFSGTYPNCTATIQVGASSGGSSNLTLTVSNGNTASSSFTYYVIAAASAAFSLRKMVVGYSGSAINIIRSSDSTNLDIGFNASGDLNTTTVASFCSSTTCKVRTWYDQSGNGRNATNSTGSSQPVLTTSGGSIANSINSYPAITFYNSGYTHLDVSTISFSGSAFTVNYTNVYSSTGSYYTIISDYGTGLYNSLGEIGSNPLAMDIMHNGTSDSASATLTVAANTPAIQTWTSTTSAAPFTATPYLNGTAGSALSLAGFSTLSGGFQIGADASNGDSFRGYMAELFVFPSVLSTANRQALEHNQESYFNISGV